MESLYFSFLLLEVLGLCSRGGGRFLLLLLERHVLYVAVLQLLFQIDDAGRRKRLQVGELLLQHDDLVLVRAILTIHLALLPLKHSLRRLEGIDLVVTTAQCRRHLCSLLGRAGQLLLERFDFLVSGSFGLFNV